jgi:2-dehydro-3-deoxygluconokinase
MTGYRWARSCSVWTPGEGRIRSARSIRVWEGGGEYNVARGLRRCFGQRTAVVTALADNDVGWRLRSG